MLTKQQASVILERILQAHDKRSMVVVQYADTITGFKQSQNVASFRKTKKSLDDQFKTCSESISKHSKDLQGVDSEGNTKVGVCVLACVCVNVSVCVCV